LGVHLQPEVEAIELPQELVGIDFVILIVNLATSWELDQVQYLLGGVKAMLRPPGGLAERVGRLVQQLCELRHYLLVLYLFMIFLIYFNFDYIAILSMQIKNNIIL